MEIIGAVREHIRTRYTLSIEHEGVNYEWETLVDDHDISSVIYLGQTQIETPEWLEDADFFELFDEALKD